jgi:hypothetical protein
VLLPLCALGFLLWTDAARVKRIEYVSSLAPWSTEAPAIDARSPTGYAGGTRRLIALEHENRSYQWIVQTQQMIARGEWRVRHVDYDNAPFGRGTRSASPYRWWLGLLAWIDHAISGRPVAASVERAALFAGPALHVLLLITATVFAVRRFGGAAAAVVSASVAVAFPLAGEFLPGAPDDRGLMLVFALGSLLPLLAGLLTMCETEARPNGEAPTSAVRQKRVRRDFFLAGLVGGIGLWIDASFQAPLVLGIMVGAVAVAWISRRSADAEPEWEVPWRLWAVGGCLASLVGYMVEYFPREMALRFDGNHPLFGIAWLGAGELLSRIVTKIQRGKLTWRTWDIAAVLFALMAVAALPLANWWSGADFFGGDFRTTRLTLLNGGIAAPNLGAWIARDGFSLAVVSSCLPALLVAFAVALLVGRGVQREHQRVIALALGPVVVALAFACARLAWWSVAETALLGLAIAVGLALAGVARSALSRGVATATLVVLFAAGVSLLSLKLPAGPPDTLSQVEVRGMVERDVAYWLRSRFGPDSVVLTTPALTTTLGFHGGLRGIGTFDAENQTGFSAATRMASATTADEALELMRNRGVTHVVIPSWDSFLDEYARIGLRASPGSSLYEKSFIASLHRWTLPRWLHPVPYQLPPIGGFEGQAVIVLQMVDEQEEVIALSRMAEYFVEMEQVEAATAVREDLLRFRGNIAALVALAQIAGARNDSAGHADAAKKLVSFLNTGADRGLPWDRRVSLAILLAQVKQVDLARDQARRCLAEMNETKLRWLTTHSLFRFRAICKIFTLEITDPQLRELTRERLPPGLRKRLEAPAAGGAATP